MSSKKHERRLARENALALLYSCDITDLDIVEAVEEGAFPEDAFRLSAYAERLLRGVAAHLDEVDARLASTSENWSVERMPVADRAVLRLATYEMLYVDEVPISVSVNEAVELAKQFGGEDDSARFVNGVLGRIARSIEADAAESGAADAGTVTGGVARDAMGGEGAGAEADAPDVVAETAGTSDTHHSAG